MKRIPISLSLLLPCLLLSAVACGQTSLDELERRLEALPGGEREAAAPLPGYLGLTAADTLTESGAQVLTVNPGGPAAKAGIQRGDIITAIGGTPIRNLDEMGRALGTITAGEQVDFDVLKGERKVRIRVTLGRRPGTSPAPRAAEPGPTLGVIVTPITAALREKFRLGVASGAVVDSVQEGSPAAKAGLVPGAAIVAMDGVRIDDPDQLARRIAVMRTGQEVELAFYIGGELHREKVRLADGSGGEVADAGDRLDVARPVVESPAEELAALKREMAELQARMAELQRRLEAVEARLPK